MNTHLAGILPAVVTPLSNEEFATRPFELLLERLYGAGVHGVYVCGQTGEGLLQTTEMRREVAEAAVRCSSPGKTVIVHVGAARTQDAVKLARHASRAGAHAVSSLPPAGGYSFAEVRTYYERIAAASDLPVLVYYFPEFSKAIASPEQIDELCSIPGVVGLKFTDFDLLTLSLLSRSGKVVFNGRDEVLAAGLLMGAAGGIGSFYNVAPELFVQVYELAGQSRWDEARLVQDRINDLISAAIRYPVFPAVKAMLRWSGIDCGECIQPRRSLTPGEEQELRRVLGDRGFDPTAFPAARAGTSA